ncbi:hypothetical protein RchiOBHm_Chr1g0372071 [Rosa chinensis]|uniref:Uncharacterized protein n=1 Tax=Rosa chinensis TaxID=74649 RepID=A0A2P6SLR1_ROSCH|nr:hypothetical protein RchiOBHm_Chr1g0372071 [Rosa chinensis]
MYLAAGAPNYLYNGYIGASAIHLGGGHRIQVLTEQWQTKKPSRRGGSGCVVVSLPKTRGGRASWLGGLWVGLGSIFPRPEGGQQEAASPSGAKTGSDWLRSDRRDSIWSVLRGTVG